MDLWFEKALLPDGWAADVRIAIKGGRIDSLSPGSTPMADDTRAAIGIPGLGNVHSHAFQRGMAGLAECRGPERDSFWTWREVMYRFASSLTPETLRPLAELAYVEMLESGFTRVGEFHYVHHDPDGHCYADRGAMAGAIAEAARQTGIGLTLLPVYYASPGFGGGELSPLQRRFCNDPDSFADLLAACDRKIADLPDAVLGVAPHSLRAVPLATLEQLAQLRPSAPVHIHISEQLREVEDCLAWSGRTPIALLANTIDLDHRWCLVHATHATRAEIDLVLASEAVVGLCPITEANLGDGLFPAVDFVSRDGRFAVGSDSNVRIDAAEELCLLEYGQRLTQRQRNLLAHPFPSVGRSLFEGALAGAAQALGAEALGLQAGAPADIISLDTAHPALVSGQTDSILDAFVFCGGPSMIDRVWRSGTLVVAGGRHIMRDIVVRRYAEAMRTIIGGE